MFTWFCLLGWVFPVFFPQNKRQGLNHSTDHPCRTRQGPGTADLLFSHLTCVPDFPRRTLFSRSFSRKTPGRDDPSVPPDTLKLFYPVALRLADQKHAGASVALSGVGKQRPLGPGSIRAQKTYSTSLEYFSHIRGRDSGFLSLCDCSNNTFTCTGQCPELIN